MSFRKNTKTKKNPLSPEAIQLLFEIRRNEIFSTLDKANLNKWDASSLAKFIDSVNELEEYLPQFDPKQRVLTHLILVNAWMCLSIKSLRVDDKYTLEKGESHLVPAKKIFKEEIESFSSEYQTIASECFKIAEIFIDVVHQYSNILHLNFNKCDLASKANKALRKNMLSIENLINNESNEVKATEMTDKVFLAKKETADALALKMHKIIDENNMSEILRKRDDIEEEDTLKGFYFYRFIFMMSLISEMNKNFSVIINHHYTIPQLEAIFSAAETTENEINRIKNIFANYKRINQEVVRFLDIIIKDKNSDSAESAIKKDYDKCLENLKTISVSEKKIDELYKVYLENQKDKNNKKTFLAEMQLVASFQINPQKSQQTQTKKKKKKKSKTTAIKKEKDEKSSDNQDQKNNQGEKTSPIEKPEDKASKLYAKGKYSSAIDIHKSLLPEKLEEANTLEQFRSMVTIAENYKAWSDFALLNLKENKRTYKLRKKDSKEYKALAKQYFSSAFKGLSSKISKVDSFSSEYSDWKMWQHMAQINIADSRNYLDFAAKENAESEKITPISNKTLAEDGTEKLISIAPSPQLISSPAPIEANEKVVKTKLKHAPHSLTSTPMSKFKFKALSIPLNPTVEDKINLLAEKMDVWIVGGAPRNALEGEAINDYDVVVSKSLNNVRKTLKVPYEIYGVITRPVLRIANENENLDISPLMGAFDSNNQKSVTLKNGLKVFYTPANSGDDSIYEDALKRDYTINALYYKHNKKLVYDPTGLGLQHLEERILCTVIEPDKSFTEDAIRIMRGIRLSILKKLTIEPNTKAAMIRNAHLVLKYPQRILLEFDKLIKDNITYDGIMQLHQIGLLEHIFPGMNSILSSSPSVSKKLIENMTYKIDHPFTPRSYKNLPFFLATMLWNLIEKKMLEIKFSPEDQHQILVDEVEKILDKYKVTLGLTKEMQEILRLIWRNHLARHFGHQDQYLLDTVYSADELDSMNAFSGMVFKTQRDFVNHYKNNPMLAFTPVNPSLETSNKAEVSIGYTGPQY